MAGLVPSKKDAWIPVIVLLVSFLAYLGATSIALPRADQALSPGPCATIGCLARTKPAPQKVAEIRIDGREYIVWRGELRPKWLLPSGPSCYVFDDRGRLITWAPQTGEGGPVDRFDEAARLAEPVDLGAILERSGRG